MRFVIFLGQVVISERRRADWRLLLIGNGYSLGETFGDGRRSG